MGTAGACGVPDHPMAMALHLDNINNGNNKNPLTVLVSRDEWSFSCWYLKHIIIINRAFSES